MYFSDVIPAISSAAHVCCVQFFIIIIKSLNDGSQFFHQHDIHICCERFVPSLRNMFKFLGHTQFLEICATAKENVSFHDNGLVLFRFACGLNKSSIDGSSRCVTADGKVARLPWLGGYFGKPVQ
jgi:hypothetical protein